MTAGRLKSRVMRRVFRRTPSGKVRMSYVKRKPSKAKCAVCGGVLKGTMSERPYIMMNLGRSKKRPQRPYGGVLCSRCMRRRIIKASRQQTVKSG